MVSFYLYTISIKLQKADSMSWAVSLQKGKQITTSETVFFKKGNKEFSLSHQPLSYLLWEVFLKYLKYFINGLVK